MAIAVRGTSIGYIDNASTATLALPGGSSAGDYCLLLVAHGFLPDPMSVSKWRQIDDEEVSGSAGAAFERILTASDISAGSVIIGFGDNYSRNAGYGVIALVAFVGSNSGHRTFVALPNNTGSTTRTIATDATPQAGDYAVLFGFGQLKGVVTSSVGATLNSTDNLHGSAIVAGTLLGGGSVSSTFTYTPDLTFPASTADFQIIVVVSATTVSPLHLRAALLTLEPLSYDSSTLRAPLITIDSLDEGFRNLRVSGFFVEALYPVPPEGHVSTELFPGSLGSLTALPGLTYSIHKRPTFSTSVFKGATGVSVRTANMQYPIWEFELTYEFLRDNVNNEYQTLCGFFMSRLGGFDTFLLKDKDDYQVTGGTIGTADGVTTQFPFLRNFGGFSEKVGQVDVGHTVNIYDNGVLKTAGVHYNIVLPNHVVFVTAPTATHTITADFQFFFNCRFQDDQADFDKFAETFWELQKIVLETVPQ